MQSMQEDSGIKLASLQVDGGACANNFLMQFQADIMNAKVARPRTIETTAMGAAYLAGLAVGYWESKEVIKQNHEIAKTFVPNMEEATRSKLLRGWHNAVAASCVRIAAEE